MKRGGVDNVNGVDKTRWIEADNKLDVGLIWYGSRTLFLRSLNHPWNGSIDPAMPVMTATVMYMRMIAGWHANLSQTVSVLFSFCLPGAPALSFSCSSFSCSSFSLFPRSLHFFSFPSYSPTSNSPSSLPLLSLLQFPLHPFISTKKKKRL